MDNILGRAVHQSNYDLSIGNSTVAVLIFADDAFILFESLEVLVLALAALYKETKLLRLQVSRAKTKLQVSFFKVMHALPSHQPLLN